jgi:hypothetical protein
VSAFQDVLSLLEGQPTAVRSAWEPTMANLGHAYRKLMTAAAEQALEDEVLGLRSGKGGGAAFGK